MKKMKNSINSMLNNLTNSKLVKKRISIMKRGNMKSNKKKIKIRKNFKINRRSIKIYRKIIKIKVKNMRLIKIMRNNKKVPNKNKKKKNSKILNLCVLKLYKENSERNIVRIQEDKTKEQYNSNIKKMPMRMMQKAKNQMIVITSLKLRINNKK
jgi:hypothetical protein